MGLNVNVDINAALESLKKSRNLSDEIQQKEERAYKEHFLTCSIEKLQHIATLYKKNRWIDLYDDNIQYDSVPYDNAVMQLYQIQNDCKMRIDPILYDTAKIYFEKYGRPRLQ